MRTLPDYLAPGLRVLSIGLNPSVPSIAAGYYFSNPRNRFWQALNGSCLLDAPLQPGTDAMQCLFKDYGIGFTDLVKRPSRGSAELRAADYKAGAQRLHSVLENCQPAIAWFHGKVAYKQFLRRIGRPDKADRWGLQSQPIGTTQCFVTPNPSPANAVFSLPELIAWYDLLAKRVRSSS